MWRKASALAVLMVLAFSACSAAKDTGFPPPPKTTEPPKTTAPPASGPVTLTGPVDVADNLFAPKTAAIKVGTEVVWKQSGSEPHTVTSDTSAFDSNPKCAATTPSDCLASGGEFRHTFTKAGAYPYYCKIHGAAGGAWMAGTIIVQP